MTEWVRSMERPFLDFQASWQCLRLCIKAESSMPAEPLPSSEQAPATDACAVVGPAAATGKERAPEEQPVNDFEATLSNG